MKEHEQQSENLLKSGTHMYILWSMVWNIWVEFHESCMSGYGRWSVAGAHLTTSGDVDSWSAWNSSKKMVKHRIYIMELYSLLFNSFAHFQKYNPKYTPVYFLKGLVTVWLELLNVKDSCPIVNYLGIKIDQLT